MQSLPFHLIRFGLLLAMLFMQPALAGDMTLESLSSRFPPPLHVQPKLSDIPAWPITSELEPEGGPIGYVFESIDLAPIPGFEGTPMNLLVAIDRKGNFIDVAVLRQHEPVFLSGLGEVPLNEFVRQYAGKNLRQDFTVASAYGNAKAGAGDNRVVLDGVTKATASVRIVNQTVLAAGLAVARSKLGFADPGSRGPPAELRRDIAETLDFATLVERGLIATLRVTHAEAEKLFAGSEGEGVDDEALANPDGTLIELYVGYLNLPTVGRTVLGDARYGDLMQKLEPGQHALWVASTGRDRLLDDSFVPGTAPPKLQLTQGGYPAEMRDLVFEHPAPPGAPEFNSSGVFRVYAASNLDPAQAMQLTLTLTRAKGIMLPRITNKSVSVDYTLPDRYFVYPPKPLPEWLIAWQGRWPDLALIGAALVLLSAVLAKPQWMARDARRLVWFRLAFLAVHPGATSAGTPRGSCPSCRSPGPSNPWWPGAEPEELSLRPGEPAADRLHPGQLRGVGPRHLLRLAVPLRRAAGVRRPGSPAPCACPNANCPPGWPHVLDRGRFVILAALAGWPRSPPSGPRSLVEVEPFKTAITVGFDRSGPMWPMR
jgi:NosR/NirI family nitrous oxide reductase transcriptional regulator